MPSFGPGDLDILARAFYRAIDEAPQSERDAEETKAILMTGLIDAAHRGVRDEDVLTDSALSALALYDDRDMQAVIRQTLL